MNEKNEATNDLPKDSMAEAWAGSMPLPGRDKTWDESTSDEKIERLRGVVKAQEATIQYLGETINRLMNHSHDHNGNLVGPLWGAGPMSMEAGIFRRRHPLD